MAVAPQHSHLAETFVSGSQVFAGRMLNVCRDIVALPGGSTTVREYVKHPGAVMVIPLLEESSGMMRVVLERQFRYPMGRVMVEFPAGKLDPGEATFDCAQRELREETGYIATEWAYAGVLHPVISYSTEFIEVWFARGLAAGAQKLDSDELLDVFDASPDELLDWCQSGAVTDAKTLTGTLWLQNVLQGKWSLEWKRVRV